VGARDSVGVVAHAARDPTMAAFDASLPSVPRSGRGVSARPRSDAALVRDACRGSAAAWEALFARHWPQAYRAAYLVVHDAAAAEDAAQEAFVAAAAALERFDRRRPFAPWLHRIVVNRAIDHARRAARRHEAGDAAAGEAGGWDAVAPDDGLLGELRALSPEHRAVVVLRYVLDWTPGEIAAALELPRGTVNSRLRRALDVLGRRLEEPG
jgi:RNA polymerase sigma-70 factor (ECF subfamily)